MTDKKDGKIDPRQLKKTLVLTEKSFDREFLKEAVIRAIDSLPEKELKKLYLSVEYSIVYWERELSEE